MSDRSLEAMANPGDCGRCYSPNPGPLTTVTNFRTQEPWHLCADCLKTYRIAEAALAGKPGWDAKP